MPARARSSAPAAPAAKRARQKKSEPTARSFEVGSMWLVRPAGVRNQQSARVVRRSARTVTVAWDPPLPILEPKASFDAGWFGANAVAMAGLVNTHVERDVWCRVGRSKADPDGVGLIALRDIPKGTVVNRVPASLAAPPGATRVIHEFTARNLPAAAPPGSALANYLCNVQCDCTPLGMNVMTLDCFVNHSATPNCRHSDAGDGLERDDLQVGWEYLVTTRAVKEGEELCTDFQRSYHDDGDYLKRIGFRHWGKKAA